MTRKDYILLADAMARSIPSRAFHTHGAFETAYSQWRQDCLTLGDALARDNPRFDRARFLTACGIKE